MTSRRDISDMISARTANLVTKDVFDAHRHDSLYALKSEIQAANYSTKRDLSAYVPMSQIEKLRGPKGDTGPVGPQGPQGATGQVGPAGPAGPIGIGVQRVAYDQASGNLVFTMTNNTSQGPFNVRGAPGPVGPVGPVGAVGPAGAAGVGIQLATYDQATGNLLFAMTNNTSQGPFNVRGAQGPVGPTGPAGRDGAPGPVGPAGAPGAAGVGIQRATYDQATGNLLFAMTNNTSQGPFNVRGAQGPVGPAGNYDNTFDFTLGRGNQTDRGDTGPSRALVKDGNRALTINFENDFAGGVNLNARGGLRVSGNTDIAGTLATGDTILGPRQANSWILHAPNDPRNLLFIAPGANGGNWDWSKQTTLDKAGNAGFSGNVRAGGELTMTGRNVVHFGSDQEKEVNAGKIGYGTFDNLASLNIVGAGKNGENRSVRVWENVMATNAIGVGDMPRDWRGANFVRKDGRWTHFDWRDDGRNYIRGDTVVDGRLFAQGRTCRDANTQWDADGGGNALFLDRHNVACNDDEMITRMKLSRNPQNLSQYRYDYRCCKLG